MDYNPDLYEWQDTNVERPPKYMENRTLGYLLEAAGDIFRELTDRQWPAAQYIGEKTARIERALSNPRDVEELTESLSMKDQSRTVKLIQRWKSLPSEKLSPLLEVVRQLNVSLAEQDPSGTSANLARFNAMYVPKSPFRSRRHPEVHVRQHKRRV